jgi:hypothetical protein
VFILGAGSTDEVVVDGDVIPVVGLPLFTFVAPEADANSSGDVVFYGGGVRGVYVRVTGSLTAIAFEAGTAPGTPSSTYSFASAAKPSINEAGQIAFHAYRDPTAGGGLVSTVFIAEPGGSVTIASTQGDPVPGDPGRSFVNVGNPVINDAGELAFIGLSLDGGDLIWGIYVWRQGEVEVVAETGLEVLGTGAAQIASLDFNEIGFNNSGEVAFIAVLDDDRRGVLLASPAVALVPALTSRSLLVLAAVLASVGIRRRLGRISWVFGNARYAEFC